jgi:predicted nucleotidyltransferase/predicted transcriptional regulator
MDSLVDIVGSRSRAEVFRLLFEQPGTELYLREIHRRSGLSIRPIQEELANLEARGLIKTRKDGNRTYYSANTQHPLFPEVRGLVEKTTGLRALLQRALSDPEIQYAFIFGSVASRTARPGSDLDLFVIGTLGLRKLTKLLSGLSDTIGREINPHVMTSQEFVRRIRAKDHFISSVMSAKKTFVIGDQDELERLGKKRLAKTA